MSQERAKIKNSHDAERESRRRMYEFIAIGAVTAVLLLLSRLQTRLFELSEALSKSKEFISTIFYFGIINIDIILILLLSFLVFRNIAKLIIERRRGVFGSKLRSKLVVSLVLFASAPTILIFFISFQFITASFDKWFSERVKSTVEQAKEATNMVYEQTQIRLETILRLSETKIVIHWPQDFFKLSGAGFATEDLEKFVKDYNLQSFHLLNAGGSIIWPLERQGQYLQGLEGGFVFSGLRSFQDEPQKRVFSEVHGEANNDVIKALVPIYDPSGINVIAAVYAKEVFETNFVGSIQTILAEFSSLRPGAELLKLSFLVLMLVMTLLIIFAAIWLGFYVAKGITMPLQSLAYATRQIALGNYQVNIDANAQDEAGQLIKSFNQMTRDLQKHKNQAKEAQQSLVTSNEELERRRQYMETVLRNITSGVIALDEHDCVTAINTAAEKLLEITGTTVLKRQIEKGLGAQLSKLFWEPISDDLHLRGQYHGELDLINAGLEVSLLIDAARIFDEQDGRQIGTVIVFEDVREKIRAQRAAAWREVARRIAHEIKNPLTPIKLSTQRILRRFHDKFTGEEKEIFNTCIETILHQVDTLRNLVNEFSKFARLPQINPEMMDINVLVKELVTMYRASYPNINFDLQNLEPLPLLYADKEQLNRVFVNLVSNAIAALKDTATTVATPEISIRSEVDKNLGFVRVSIIDNGPGIPAALRERVLEPYFSTKDEGTGLGLAIVNQIISDHGGYLRISDHHPQGAIFTIELPLPKSNLNKSQLSD